MPSINIVENFINDHICNKNTENYINKNRASSVLSKTPEDKCLTHVKHDNKLNGTRFFEKNINNCLELKNSVEKTIFF